MISFKNSSTKEGKNKEIEDTTKKIGILVMLIPNQDVPKKKKKKKPYLNVIL